MGRGGDADRVGRPLPRTARLEAPVPAATVNQERPLERVPVGHPAVLRPAALEELPVVGRPQDREWFAAQPRRCLQDVDREHRADSVAVEHVACVEEAVGAVDVEERARVDAKRSFGVTSTSQSTNCPSGLSATPPTRSQYCGYTGLR